MKRIMLALIIVSLMSSVSIAQIDPDDINWSDGFMLPGLDGQVYAMIEYNGNLIVGGNFHYADAIEVNGVARWDGSSWSALWSGVQGEVRALAVYKGLLIVGGKFDEAGGIPVENIASWNGTAWGTLGSGTNQAYSNQVKALTIYNSNLIAAGQFNTMDGISVNKIASWNGSSWSPLGSGLNGDVYSLGVYNGDLIAGGGFSSAGGIPASRIASWDGTTWNPLGTGINSYDYAYYVYSLVVYDGDLVVGGRFTTAGGVSALRIASWDGSSWGSLGSGMNGYVYSVAVYNNNLIAGGTFTTAGGFPASRIANWDGSNWSALGSGFGETVNALCVYNDSLIASGSSGSANIAKWDGAAWDPMTNITGNGLNGDVNDMTIFNGNLVVGGSFSIAGGITVNNIAVWDGSSWSALGDGVNGTVYALDTWDGGLVVGGYFNSAGDSVVSNIATWDGQGWSALGSGLNGTVYALYASGGAVTAGGSFNHAGDIETGPLARYTTYNNSWSARGTSFLMRNMDPEWATYGSVYALENSSMGLIIGGDFTTYEFVWDDWNNTSWNIAVDYAWGWRSPGTGLDMPVRTLINHEGAIIAGGDFTRTYNGWYSGPGTPVNHIIRIDDINSWDSLGAGLNGSVTSLITYGGALFAGGRFSSSGGSPVNHIAGWDGSEWDDLGSGIQGNVVNAMASYPSESNSPSLYVGGRFSAAGNTPSSNFAKWLSDHDIRILRINNPENMVGPNSQVIPSAVILNAGIYSESFSAIFRIGDIYADTVVYSNLPAGDSVVISFAPWAFDISGDYEIRIEALLDEDQNKFNNAAWGSFVIPEPELSLYIHEPSGPIGKSVEIIPKVNIENSGLFDESFLVVLEIADIYSDTVIVNDLMAGTNADIVFTPLSIHELGEYQAVSYMLLRSNGYPSTDTVESAFFIPPPSYQAQEIISPGISELMTTTITPQVSVYNAGNAVDTFWATFRISDFYADTVMVQNIPPGENQIVSFAPCNFEYAGSNIPLSFRILINDVNIDDNKIDTIISVYNESGFKIRRLAPNHGLADSIASTAIIGDGFLPGITAELSLMGEANIIADELAVNFISDTLVEAEFDLTGAIIDRWDFKAINSTDETFTIHDGYAVKPVEGYLPFCEMRSFSIHDGSTMSVALDIPEAENIFVTVKKSNRIGRTGTWYGDIKFFKDSSNILSQSLGGSDVIFHHKNIPSGVYQLDISAFDPGDCNIEVCYSLDEVTLGDWYIGEILRPYGYDWVQFDVPENQSTLYFETEGVGMHSTIDVYYEDINGDGHLTRFGCNNCGYRVRGQISNPAAGRYYLRYMDSAVLNAGGSQWRDYMLYINTEPSTTQPSIKPVITGISTYTCGQGPVTIEVSGSGFDTLSSVFITRGEFENIPAKSVKMDFDKNRLCAYFDFSETEIGTWSLIVENTYGQSDTAKGLLSITGGGEPELRVEIMGRDLLRGGRRQTYVFRVSNVGTIDIWGAWLMIGISDRIEWYVRENGQYIPGGNSGSNGKTIMVELTHLASGETRDIWLAFLSNYYSGHMTLAAEITPDLSGYLEARYEPFYLENASPKVQVNNQDYIATPSNSDYPFKIGPKEPSKSGYLHKFWITDDNGNVYEENAVSLGGEYLAWSFPGRGVEIVTYDDIFDPNGDFGDLNIKHEGSYRPHPDWSDELANDVPVKLANYMGMEFDAGSRGEKISCQALYRRLIFKDVLGWNHEDFASWDKDADNKLESWEMWKAIWELNFANQQGFPLDFDVLDWLQRLFDGFKQLIISLIGSSTPEDKYGLIGFDLSGTPKNELRRFLSNRKSAFDYRIDFWNKEDASAPAQVVFVEDTLDCDFDIKSFGFTDFGFLRWNVPVGGGQYFNVDVDMRPDESLLVNVEGTVDPDNRVVKWVFRSLDPITGEIPEDPLVGFLPPIDSMGYNIGWVDFTIDLLSDLTTGTQLTNQAFVNFDSLPVCDTCPFWSPAPKERPYLNTIDADPPNSNVFVLQDTINTPAFTVSWEGSDDSLGSGIKSFSIYYSEDGLLFNPWLTDTTASSAEFMGEYDRTYYFYSIATDNVGHIESPPDSADAVITITPSFGTLSGFVLADSVEGLLGVNIDIQDSEGALLTSLATDDSGYFRIDSLIAGKYSITAMTPLGYMTNQEMKEIIISHGPYEMNFYFNRLDITPQQRSRAYWAHQIGKALQNQPKDYSLDDFSGFAGLIDQHFNNNPINPVENYIVPQPSSQYDSLTVLNDLLTFKYFEEDEHVLKRIARGQLVALMLNVVSGKVSQQEIISADSMNVSQAITYCDLLVNDLDCPLFEIPEWYLADYSSWSNLQRYIAANFVAGLVNVGVILQAGVIPPNIEDIAYKYWENRGLLPKEFGLSQNYPNPFNPTTIIEFALPRASDVTIEIYNILGRRVKILVDDHFEAGYHSVKWNGINSHGGEVATGIYLYRIRAGDFTDSKKMLLIK